MAKAKGKKKGSGIGPYPKIPPLTNVDIDTGIGKISGELAKARKAGKDAAGGQLATISDKAMRGVDNQIAKADARTSRIMRNMKRIEEQQRMLGKGLRKGVTAETRHQMALGGPRASGITGARRRTTATATAATNKVASGMVDQGQKMKRAEMSALTAYGRSEQRSNKASRSILDVLAAERRSDDVRYIEGLKHEEKMMELQHAQQLQLQQLGFAQDMYKMKYQTKMEKEFINWQMDKGLLLTPEDEAALEWRYEKKGIQLPYRLEEQKAKLEGQETQFHSFDTQMSSIEDGIQSATETWNSPGRRAKAVAAYPNLPTNEAVATYTSDLIARTTPEGVEMSAVNAAVRQTVDNIAGGGLAPTYEEVKSLIEQTSPEMREYLETNPNLAAVHDSYRTIRTAQSTLGDSAFGREAAKTGDSSFLDQALGVAHGAANATVAFGLPAALGAAAWKAGEGATILTESGAVGKAGALQRLGQGGAQLTDDAVTAVRGFLSKPGAFQGAVKGALGKMGRVNPFGGAGASTGAASSSALASLGLIAGAGLMSHKLIDDAATQFQFAEAAEDENLQSTFNLMDATAEAIIAGRVEPTQLDKIASAITSQEGGAGNLWSSDIGWTGPQKEMVANRLTALKGYIESMRNR